MTRKQALAKFCVEEAEKLAEGGGFVSIRALAERFRATIVLRPLLVEAMLASRHCRADSEDADRNLEWLVLIDSEQHSVTNEALQNEEPSLPLPARFRNTVAHELAHSLIFRSEELGFKIQLAQKKGEERDSFLRRIETEAEQFSPLLLIPQSRIARLSKKTSLEMSNLEALCSECGVSREVLINRLRLLSIFDPEDICLNSGFRNVAIGLGEWADNSKALLKPWPLFFNFDDNRLPEFIVKLHQNREILVQDITDDKDFLPNGGSSNTAVFKANDSPDHPDYMRMKIRMTVQQTNRRARSGFLFLVNKI